MFESSVVARNVPALARYFGSFCADCTRNATACISAWITPSFSCSRASSSWFVMGSLRKTESETQRELRLVREENAALRRVMMGRGA